MRTILIVNARLVTLRGPAGPRRGGALEDLGVIERGFVKIEGSRIALHLVAFRQEASDRAIPAGLACEPLPGRGSSRFPVRMKTSHERILASHGREMACPIRMAASS